MPASQTPISYVMPDFWRDVRVHLLLVAIVLVAVGMRIPYIGTVGHGDLPYFYAPWTRAIQRNGLFQIYAVQDNLNYAPLYVYIMGVIAAVLPISNESFFVYFDPQLLFLLKFIPIASEVLIIVAAYYWLPHDGRLRWMIPLVIAIYPGLVATTASWGQTDALLCLLLVICLMALNRDRIRWSWAMWGLALLMKFQAIVLLPLLACLSFRRYGLKRTIGGGIIAAVIVVVGVIPFVIGSGWDHAMRPYFGTVDLYPSTTLNAFNLWHVVNPDNWIISPLPPPQFKLVYDTLLLFSSISYKTIGLILLGTYVLLIVVNAWRTSEQRRELVWAAALYMGFFVLPTQIHERYLYPAAVFLLIGIAQERRLWPIALGVMATYSYNVAAALVEPFYWFSINFLTVFGNIAVVVALMNIGLLAWVTWVVVRPKGRL